MIFIESGNNLIEITSEGLPLKILHIIDSLSYSGVATYTVRLIKALPQYNHTIISCYNGNAKTEIKNLNHSYQTLINKPEVKYRYLLMKYWKFVSFIVKNRFDIIHYHQGGVGLILLALIFGKKAKVIHHLHSGNLIGDNRSRNISIIHLLLLKLVSKLTYQVAVADHVFCEYKSKIKNITNLRIVKNSAPFKYKQKKEISNSVGYIGRFTKEKGFPVFLSIAAQLKNEKSGLNIYVKGEAIEQENIPVTIISPSFDVESFYNKIDLLIFTSKAPESLPLVIHEAISFDVGVIAYPIKGVVEILGEDYPLYVNNPDEAILKINDFYSDNFDRDNLSRIHQERSSKFLFDDVVEKIDSLYKCILN